MNVPYEIWIRPRFLLQLKMKKYEIAYWLLNITLCKHYNKTKVCACIWYGVNIFSRFGSHELYEVAGALYQSDYYF